MPEKSTAVQPAPEPTGLKLVEPKSLLEQFDQIHESIARRAFEFFEHEGGLFGRDWDHWFRAESELLHPVHMNISESDNALTVDAEVPGFNANELKISLEPRRLTVSGKRQITKEDKKKGTMIYSEQCSSELLRVIDLPSEIDPTKSTATLKNGVLELHLPKTAQAKTTHVEIKPA